MALPEGDDVLLLHNPRCSKSRATKDLLEARGVAFEERLYLESPLDRAELEELARRLGRPPGDWVRRKETAFVEAGLGPDADAALYLDVLVRHPIVMERPVVVRGRRAVIGRPPEAVLALFEQGDSRGSLSP